MSSRFEDETDYVYDDWVDCWGCGGEGVIDGECTCMQDTCCCLHPDPPVCNVCNGKGGWRLDE